MNYNALLHPEILATKHGRNKNELTYDLATSVPPTELSLMEGLAATLVDRIVDYKIKEASSN